MKTQHLLLATTLTFWTACVATAVEDAQNNWPQWRGPLATGVAPHADPPLEWSEDKNVKWKVKLPGSGTATPIIWGNKVFILTAIKVDRKTAAADAETVAPAMIEGLPLRDQEHRTGLGSDDPPPTLAQQNPPGSPPPGEPGRPRGGLPGGGGQRSGGGGRAEKPTDPYQFTVLCLDRQTGKTLWQQVAIEKVPHEGHHPDHGFASASPVTDGEHVLAYFGSRGLHCYDMDGKKKWSKEFGDMRTRAGFGEGASPALHGSTVVVNWDDETDNDFIVALDKRTGKELWKMPRSEATGWATPLIVEHDKKLQVVVNASEKVRAYELTTGKEIWTCSGQTPNAIPTPVADADTVYATSGFKGAACYAIALGRTGELKDTDAVRWSHNKDTPYVPSPLLAGDLLYLVSGNKPVLTCLDAKSGKPKFDAERIEGLFGIYASPVAAKDRVYVLGREGKCVVLKQGSKLEILATNKLDDKTDASIAMAGKELFIRGHESLYCIAAK